MASSTNASSLPTRSQIEAWGVEHLKAGAAWLPGHAEVWFDATETPWRVVERASWEGPAANAARDVYRSIRSQAHAGAEHLENTARLLTQAADQISAAQQRATRAIRDAEDADFSVSEDLKVSFDSTGLTAAETAAKAADLEIHASEILSAATNLGSTEESFARSITSATSLLEDLITERKPRSAPATAPTVQATSFTPKLAPAEAPGGSSADQQDGGSTRRGDSETNSDEGRTQRDEQSDSKDDGKAERDDKPSEAEDAKSGDEAAEAGGQTQRDTITNSEDGQPQRDDQPSVGMNPVPGQAASVPMSSPASTAMGGGIKPAVSSPISPLTNPLGSGASSAAGSGGGGQGVSPAALDKAFPAASSSLLNNAPAPFAPPPAASSAGNGPVAPMTPPPTASVQQGAPLAGPSAAAPAPAAAAPIAPPPTAGGPATPMGGMLPPLMSSPTGGGVGGAPPPMTTPPAAPVNPTGPGAGVSASASPIVPMTPAERVRANIARATGNTLGRIASDVRTLCAALHRATEKRQGLRWCVGGRSDGVLLVSNNIGLGWVPNDVKLPAPDGVLSRGEHVFGHGDIPWSLRRDWVGHPVRAVRGYARATGSDVVALACYADAFDPQSDDVNGVQFDVVSESQLPAVSILTGDDRLQTVDRALAAEIASESVAALVNQLPSAMGGDDSAPDPTLAAGLWLSVTTSMAVSTDAHLEAWTAFCANQLDASVYYLRRADTVKLARQLYADYAYWRWNLEQLAQDVDRVSSTT